MSRIIFRLASVQPNGKILGYLGSAAILESIQNRLDCFSGIGREQATRFFNGEALECFVFHKSSYCRGIIVSSDSEVEQFTVALIDYGVTIKTSSSHVTNITDDVSSANVPRLITSGKLIHDRSAKEEKTVLSRLASIVDGGERIELDVDTGTILPDGTVPIRVLTLFGAEETPFIDMMLSPSYIFVNFKNVCQTTKNATAGNQNGTISQWDGLPGESSHCKRKVNTSSIHTASTSQVPSQPGQRRLRRGGLGRGHPGSGYTRQSGEDKQIERVTHLYDSLQINVDSQMNYPTTTATNTTATDRPRMERRSHSEHSNSPETSLSYRNSATVTVRPLVATTKAQPILCSETAYAAYTGLSIPINNALAEDRLSAGEIKNIAQFVTRKFEMPLESVASCILWKLATVENLEVVGHILLNWQNIFPNISLEACCKNVFEDPFFSNNRFRFYCAVCESCSRKCVSEIRGVLNLYDKELKESFMRAIGPAYSGGLQ